VPNHTPDQISELTCFKAYDVRGKIPTELNESIAFLIGLAVTEYLQASTIVIGYDVRHSSAELVESLSHGISQGGAEVVNIGLCGTEEVYFATNFLDTDGGIMVTASHNPADYNGMKIVGSGARPISMDSGLQEIKGLAEQLSSNISSNNSPTAHKNIRPDYIKKILSFVEVEHLRSLKVVVNAGNGCAGPAVDLIEELLPFEFVKLNHEPDGTFPNGIPNPLLRENQTVTSDAVVEVGADLGIAWDGDFDRCFFFDENGQFIDNYYLIGMISQVLLKQEKGSNIIHDPRLIWNTREEVQNYGGHPIQSKAGHSFIKEKMREHTAIYGGEMSGHHYFKDFYFSDSGMIPWLLVTEIMSKTNQPLSELVLKRMQQYPISGEINIKVHRPEKLLEGIKNHYQNQSVSVDDMDGYSFDFESWRFNLRMSNTEPLVRLNVETRADKKLLHTKTDEILNLIATLQE
jgi:phosphomannomutase/phosphomannomutase/phosphoglucomutase